MMGVPFERHAKVRVAIVGTGLRGSSVLGELLAVDGVQITALCDIVPAKVARAAKRVTDAGQPAPATYSSGDRAFEELVKRDDIDIVYTATPWPWHTPVCWSRADDAWPSNTALGFHAVQPISESMLIW